VKRQHPHTFESFRISLAKIVKPVVIAARDGGGERRVHIIAHHDAQADGWIERGHVQALAIHRL
jgi:hypothetical protein